MQDEFDDLAAELLQPFKTTEGGERSEEVAGVCDQARADLCNYLEQFRNPRMRRRVTRRDREFQALIKPSSKTS